MQYDQAVWQRVTEIKADPIAGANLRGLFDVLSEEIINSHLGGDRFSVDVDGSARAIRPGTTCILMARPILGCCRPIASTNSPGGSTNCRASRGLTGWSRTSAPETYR